MPTNFFTGPGIRSGGKIDARFIVTNHAYNIFMTVPAYRFFDGSLSRDTGSDNPSVLRAGLLLGKITVTELYRPSVLGLVGANLSSGGTSITVDTAVAAEVARLIIVNGGAIALNLAGPPTAGGTLAVDAISATAASGTTLTVSGVGANFVAGTLIQPADGSQNPIAPLWNPYGVDVTAIDGTSIDQMVQVLTRGADLIAAMIPNLTESDSSCQAYLKASLKRVGVFTFDNDR